MLTMPTRRAPAYERRAACRSSATGSSPTSGRSAPRMSTSFSPGRPPCRPGLKLFALLGADGKPLIVTDTRDAALANAMQNELHMVSLH